MAQRLVTRDGRTFWEGNCAVCGDALLSPRKRKYCSAACRRKAYETGHKATERRQRYKQSKLGKITERHYNSSQKGHDRNLRYRLSPTVQQRQQQKRREEAKREANWRKEVKRQVKAEGADLSDKLRSMTLPKRAWQAASKEQRLNDWYAGRWLREIRRARREHYKQEALFWRIQKEQEREIIRARAFGEITEKQAEKKLKALWAEMKDL